MPALFTRMSSRPNSQTVSATIISQVSRSVRSPATKPPFTSEATRRPRASSTSVIMTAVPSAANFRAIASPIPQAEPVTNATRFMQPRSFGTMRSQTSIVEHAGTGYRHCPSLAYCARKTATPGQWAPNTRRSSVSASGDTSLTFASIPSRCCSTARSLMPGGA